MVRSHKNLKRYVTALLLFLAAPVFAQDEAELLDRLKFAETEEAMQIEATLVRLWSQSGSKAMDLLLERGRRAMRAGDNAKAIEHLTALTDHAPEFAEGWNARATAFFLEGMYGPSIADVGRTLALNPNHFGAMSGLATMLEEMGEFSDALRVQEQLVAIHPARPGVQETLERLRRKSGGAEL